MLVTGALLTAANIGDSAAVLDTGCSMLELTDSHRIQVGCKCLSKCGGGPSAGMRLRFEFESMFDRTQSNRIQVMERHTSDMSL